MRHAVDYTDCGDWREALDEAGYWDHQAEVHRNGAGWTVLHLDDPRAYAVDELGHVEEVAA